ncbi:hypothetical protein AA313_de0206707 [Arthrobotrys entomopaga]|nr:hypothetical protein AA313_de0206707 [Arthrobotrys entomopaga]
MNATQVGCWFSRLGRLVLASKSDSSMHAYRESDVSKTKVSEVPNMSLACRFVFPAAKLAVKIQEEIQKAIYIDLFFSSEVFSFNDATNRAGCLEEILYAGSCA